MSKVLGIVIVGLAVAGCGVATEGETDQTSASTESIIGGGADSSDTSIVAVFAHAAGSNQGSLCTGTIIAPKTVLTAAHCVAPAVVGSNQVFEVYAGATFSTTATLLKVASTTFDPAFNPNDITAGHDVGIVKLAQATTLPAIPFNQRALSRSSVGSSIRIVGYGASTHQDSGAGTKRQATTTVDAVDGLTLQIGTSSKQTCHGDSGGPAIQKVNGVDTIVGITSYGGDRSQTDVCYNGGFDTRVDVYASFINAHL